MMRFGFASVLALALACASGTSPIDPGGRRDAAVPDAGPPDAGPPDGDGDGVEDALDCAPMDPGVGRSAERACEGECGAGLERCTDGTWEACDAPSGAECECMPGASRRVPCERCGTRAQSCGPDGVWADAGGCEDQGVCAPGALESDESVECAGSGALTRECAETCEWGEPVCDAGPTRLWVYPSGGSAWQRRSRDPAGPFAPRAPILAAFSIDDEREAYVLTASTFHVLALTGAEPSWVRTGPLDGTGQLPELAGAGAAPLFAWSLNLSFFEDDDPETPAGDRRYEDVVVVAEVGGAARTFLYRYDAMTRRFTFEGDSPGGDACCDWEGDPGVTAPSPLAVRAQWVDTENLDRWSDTCPAGTEPGDFGIIPSILDTGEVGVQPLCTGLLFAERVPLASFGPFAASDAPTAGDVAATFWASGLYVLRAE
ncbi:MAG TPA: hypothetical protein RMG95_03495 [Polyangiaceae bacterium LLY-WYZ-15_(1-7)]|nr:hypothetical protein [Polyangiaceae bacterium LLY-WYZ-15_(1-7)]